MFVNCRITKAVYSIPFSGQIQINQIMRDFSWQPRSFEMAPFCHRSWHHLSNYYRSIFLGSFLLPGFIFCLGFDRALVLEEFVATDCDSWFNSLILIHFAAREMLERYIICWKFGWQVVSSAVEGRWSSMNSNLLVRNLKRASVSSAKPQSFSLSILKYDFYQDARRKALTWRWHWF